MMSEEEMRAIDGAMKVVKALAAAVAVVAAFGLYRLGRSALRRRHG